MIRELNHAGLRTGNIDKAMEFYVDILGGRVIRDASSTDGQGRFVYVQLAEGVIELVKCRPEDQGLGLGHIAFLIDRDKALENVCETVKGLGCHFTVEPKTAASGDGKLAFFEDGSGAVFEFIQREENIRIPGLVNEHLKAFDHISIGVTEEKRQQCMNFYETVMGLKAVGMMEEDDKRMHYYGLGPDALEVCCSADKGLLHLGFLVADCLGTKEYLEGRGICCSEPVSSKAGGYRMEAQGPDGEVLEFFDVQRRFLP